MSVRWDLWNIGPDDVSKQVTILWGLFSIYQESQDSFWACSDSLRNVAFLSWQLDLSIFINPHRRSILIDSPNPISIDLYRCLRFSPDPGDLRQSPFRPINFFFTYIDLFSQLKPLIWARTGFAADVRITLCCDITNQVGNKHETMLEYDEWECRVLIGQFAWLKTL